MEKQLYRFVIFLSLAAASLVGQTRVSLSRQSRQADFSEQNATVPFQLGTLLPQTCVAGQAFFKVDAQPGQNLYLCTAQNNWLIFAGSGGVSLPSQANQAGKGLSTNGTQANWTALAGDVGGPLDSLNVTGLRGRAITAAAPGHGNFLRWNGGTGLWEASTTGIPNYSKSFSSQTSVMITGLEHGQGTKNLFVSCYSDQSPAVLLAPTSVTVNGTTFDVEITFATARTGSCVVNGSGGTSSGGVANIDAGSGVTVISNGANRQIGLSPATIPVFVRGLAQLGFSPILAASCQEQPFTLPGIATKDSLSPGWPELLPGGLIGVMRVSAANTITVRLCNFTSTDVAAYTDEFSATVLRSQ